MIIIENPANYFAHQSLLATSVQWQLASFFGTTFLESWTPTHVGESNVGRNTDGAKRGRSDLHPAARLGQEFGRFWKQLLLAMG